MLASGFILMGPAPMAVFAIAENGNMYSSSSNNTTSLPAPFSDQQHQQQHQHN
jgi:hypothetical protein